MNKANKDLASKQYLTLDEVAFILQLNTRSVWRMITPYKTPKGKLRPAILKAINISTGVKRHTWRVERSDLDAFIASRKK